MGKRKRKRHIGKVIVVEQRDFAASLQKALSQRKKAELLDALIELAEQDRGILRRLEARFHLEPPAPELIIATRQAIANATDFDERDVNDNFDYDHEAYAEVKRNFTHPVELGEWSSVMELSLELMRKGSYQVEMSDEGMMTEEVVECLQVVIPTLAKADLARKQLVDWCTAMLGADRVGFICDRELRALREKLSPPQ